jgi:mitochondrial fission protein ELM1
VALWLKARFGTRIVHCMRPGFRAPLFDLLVIPEHDRPAPAANVLPVLGAPHRLSPLTLLQAEAAWRERLDHLPHPRIGLLVGGGADGLLGTGELVPALAHRLGARVAAVARRMGGSVLATTSRRTGAEASEALAAGLGPAQHLLFRWGEPGENPYVAFLASADALVVTGDSVSMLSEACATAAPVFIALPEAAGPRHRRLHASLINAGQARVFSGGLTRWKRQPLDEAGRVAAEIHRRFPVE